MRDNVINAYFDCLCSFVLDRKKEHNGMKYTKLLSYLHSRDFNYILEMDSNRAEDGVDLRYRFGREMNYDNRIITAYLDDRSCSVLEMMVALVVRCEDHIMTNPEIGDRTSEWFWGMVENMGLERMSDGYFFEERAESTIDRLIDRDYGINGEGGLFTIENTGRDIRTIDIWYQMCWYLREYVKENCDA